MRGIRYKRHVYGKRRKGRFAMCVFSGIPIPVMPMIIATFKGIAEMKTAYD